MCGEDPQDPEKKKDWISDTTLRTTRDTISTKETNFRTNEKIVDPEDPSLRFRWSALSWSESNHAVETAGKIGEVHSTKYVISTATSKADGSDPTTEAAKTCINV